MVRKSLLLIALLGLVLVSWAPASTQACEFCNLSGFSNCESTTGKSCSAPGASKRCWINPACACEWGVCLCDGATGKWNCFW